jgi:4'-phosphopantetheinyl transferase
MPQPLPQIALLGAHDRTRMRDRQVQLWLQPCDGITPVQLALWLALLEPAEQAAAAALRHPQDRAAYVAAHALRRIALSQALGTHAMSLRFSQDCNGRPLLLHPHAGLYFSLSHCRTAAVFALTRIAAVGVDIEQLQPRHADVSLLEPYVALADVPGVDALHQFYFHWTALEAYWKAMGTGIRETNPRIVLDRGPAGRHTVRLEPDRAAVQRACVIAVDAHAQCALAVAIACDTSTVADATSKAGSAVAGCRVQETSLQS